MAEEFDLVVVGGGPGGYAAALYASGAGMTVAVVEKDKVGGTCLHRGCIPAKHYLETASVFRTVSGAKEFGVQADQPLLDLGISRARKQKVVDQLWKGLQGLMKRRKIKTFVGTGRLGADHVVTVDDEAGTQLQGRHVVLATGSVPRTIPGFDPDGTRILTSDHVLELDTLPASAAVIGGGAIGCEFASMLSDLGCDVTLLEALPKLLPGCDADVVDVVVKSFKRRGMTVRTGVTVEGQEQSNGQVTVRLGDGESVTVDTVVVSVGRRPLTDGLGLGDTKVEVDEKGFITVDNRQRTAEDGVYAVGDVVATPQLAHVGFAEAIVAVRDMLGEAVEPVDYGKVPWCIYCHPEVAFAGMTEQAARDAGHDVTVSKHSFNANSRALIIGEAEGLVKVIAEKRPDGKAGPILGVHMVGPWVTEQLGEGWLSLNWEATPDDMGQLIHPHPTLSETFGETVLSLTGRGLHG
ncbi:MAG TPA: dihydrolipoyl dehydrogenase [Acidimicrobiales bacterium]|nr:dihydrolipoyl dehydrogenase [Acidimicrobiales bacterium]